jgi:hypothetical protein
MANITQTIPSYVQGISTQPDELKLPGQVRDINNGLPDVAKGLVKRPGTKLIRPITNSGNGWQWFSINRDDDEKYMFAVNASGKIKVWSLIDGAQLPVYYSAKPPNLAVNEKLPAFEYEEVVKDEGWQPTEDDVSTKTLDVEVVIDDGPTTDPIYDIPEPDDIGVPEYNECDNELYTETLRAFREEEKIYLELEQELNDISAEISNQIALKENPTVLYEVTPVTKFGVEETFYLPIQTSITSATGEVDEFLRPSETSTQV